MRPWRSAKARVRDLLRKPLAVECAFQFAPEILARPARAGGEAVGYRKRIGVTRESGIVGQGGQLPEDVGGVGARRGGRCGRRNGRRGRAGRRRRAGQGRPPGGAWQPAPTSRRGRRAGRPPPAPAGPPAGRRPGPASCAWSHRSTPPGPPLERASSSSNQWAGIRQSGWRSPSTRTMPPGAGLVHTTRNEAPLGPVPQEVDINGCLGGDGRPQCGQGAPALAAPSTAPQ